MPWFKGGPRPRSVNKNWARRADGRDSGWYQTPSGILKPKNNKKFRNEFGGKSRSQRKRLIIDAGYTYTMGTGTNSTKEGYDQLVALGTMDPANWLDTEIYGVFCDTNGTPDHLRLRFGNFGVTQIPGVTDIRLTVEGAPEASYDCAWNGSNFYHLENDTTVTALHSYLNGISGTDIGIDFEDIT